jgi:hypothetical protein
MINLKLSLNSLFELTIFIHFLMDKKFNGKKIKIEFKQSSMIRVVEWSIDRSMTGQIFLRSNEPKNCQMYFRVNLIF